MVPGSTQAAERVEAPQISEDLLDIWHPQLTDVDYHNWFVPYAEQGDELLLFGIGYKEQPVGAQIVNRSAELVPEGWLSRDAGASGNQYRQMIVQGFSDDIYLIRYWFSIGGKTTANRWHAKLIRFQKKIAGRFDTEMVGLISRCHTQDCAAASETMDNIYARITTDL